MFQGNCDHDLLDYRCHVFRRERAHSATDMGNLSRAIISLFKIAGGDTWVGEGDPEDGLPVLREDGSVNWPVGVFVISYVLIIPWTLLQVSVAVLLDNFVSETTRQQVIHRFVSYLSAEHV